MPSPQSTVRYVVRLLFSGAPELSKFRSNCLLGFGTLLGRTRAIPNGGEPFHFVVRKHVIQNGDITDPRGKRRMSIAGDDPTFRIRPPFSVSIWESTDLYAVDLQQLFCDLGAKTQQMKP